MNQQYNLFSILSTLNKWRKPIIYSTIAIALLSAIVLLLLPNYFQANTTFYAASTDAAQPAPVGYGNGEKKNIYGGDADVDRLFSIAQSNEVYNYLIDNFKLYEHYDINPDGNKAQAKIRKKLSKLYTTQKSEFGGINLMVEDIDPALAKDMANSARNKINDISQQIVKDMQLKSITSFNNSIAAKQQKSTVLNDSLTRQKAKYDIYDTEAQSEAYAGLLTANESELEAYKTKLDIYKNSKLRTAWDSVRKYRVLHTSTEKQVSKLRDKIKLFNSGAVTVNKLSQELNRLNDQLSLDKERLLQLEAAHSARFDALLVVEEATIPIEKSRPKRSILLILFTLLGFILSVLIAFLIENYRKIDWAQFK